MGNRAGAASGQLPSFQERKPSPRRPDLISAVVPLLVKRFPKRSSEEIMVVACIPTAQLLHIRAAQAALKEGRFDGR